MKKFRLLALVPVVMLAFALAACDSNSDDDDADDIHDSLAGRTLVAGTCTEKVQGYDDSGSTTTYTTYEVKNIAYIVGESDDLVKVYEWLSPGSTKYYTSFYKYSISGDTITFTSSSDKSYSATISDGNSFKIAANFIDSSYNDITDENLTFTVGTAPEKAEFTKK